jgi:hypothetical protein
VHFVTPGLWRAPWEMRPIESKLLPVPPTEGRPTLHTTLRRLALAAAAISGVAAATAPAAVADTIQVETKVSVPAPYDSSALKPNKLDVDEAKGPVMLRVERKITCWRGTERRAGYGPMCQWSTGLWGSSATVAPTQGQGDVYAAAHNGYPLGTTFHAGTLREGASTVDRWAIIVRGDSLREADERFHLTTSATGGNSIQRTFTILDDDRRLQLRTTLERYRPHVVRR